MPFAQTIGGTRHVFGDPKTPLARATPPRPGDALAGVAAGAAAGRAAAQRALADLPLAQFRAEAVTPCEADEVTRLIMDRHDAAAFAPVRHLTVGGFRERLLRTAQRLGATGVALKDEMPAGILPAP